MEKLKALRKERRLTQKELAAEFSTTDSNISGWESGKWQPDLETLIKLADFFGVTVDYLLGREEQKNIIERPPYDITDKQLIDFMKLYGIMSEIQKAQVLGYVIGLLEQSGVNVKMILGY